MNREGLTDLEALVLRCRDPRARSFITEAVACYQAGAFRSCIVSTWIAVVWDVLHKLRQLDMTGDKNATTKIQQFENHRAGNRVDKLLDFEKATIDMALNDFEFISPVGAIDLRRLWDDRNRCAHPSMTSGEEEYQPSAELARAHLRNAVEYLLQHEPAQGKAALDALFADVKSVSFPTVATAATAYLRRGPLARGRPVMVKNFIVASVKALLLDDSDDLQDRRFASAIAAVCEIRRDIADRELPPVLDSLLRGPQMTDAQLPKVLFLLRLMPELWEIVDEGVQGRLRQFVREMPDEVLPLGISHALDFVPLAPEARARLIRLQTERTAELLARDPRSEYLEHAIALLGASDNFAVARNRIRRLIDPFLIAFTDHHLDRILKAITENNQLSENSAIEGLLARLQEQMIVSSEEFGRLMRKHGLSEKFPRAMPGALEMEDEVWRD